MPSIPWRSLLPIWVLLRANSAGRTWQTTLKASTSQASRLAHRATATASATAVARARRAASLAAAKTGAPAPAPTPAALALALAAADAAGGTAAAGSSFLEADAGSAASAASAAAALRLQRSLHARRLERAARRFVAKEAGAEEVALVRGSRLVSQLERHGVDLPEAFAWFVLHQRLGDTNGAAAPPSAPRAASAAGPSVLQVGETDTEGMPKPFERASTGAGSAEREPRVEQHLSARAAASRFPGLNDHPAGDPISAVEPGVCAYKLGENGRWLRRSITVSGGAIFYRPTKTCRSRRWEDEAAVLVGRSVRLPLDNMLPGHKVSKVSASELKGQHPGWDHCVIVPLRVRDFVVCMATSHEQDYFVKLFMERGGLVTTGHLPDQMGKRKLLNQALAKEPTSKPLVCDDFRDSLFEDASRLQEEAYLSPARMNVSEIASYMKAFQRSQAGQMLQLEKPETLQTYRKAKQLAQPDEFELVPIEFDSEFEESEEAELERHRRDEFELGKGGRKSHPGPAHNSRQRQRPDPGFDLIVPLGHNYTGGGSGRTSGGRPPSERRYDREPRHGGMARERDRPDFTHQEAYYRFKLWKSMGKMARKRGRILASDLRQLEKSLQVLDERLHVVMKALKEANDVDWSSMKLQREGMLTKGLKSFGRQVMDSVIQSRKGMRKNWKQFKEHFGRHDDLCRQGLVAKEKIATHKAGLDVADIKRLTLWGRKPTETRLKMETERVINALSYMKSSEEDQALALKEVERATRTVRRQAHQAMQGDHDDGSRIQSASEEALARVCQRAHLDETERVSSLWHRILKATPSPELGVRGISGIVPFIPTGFEEVLDFRNLEIGYYRWQTVGLGSSMMSLGVGGYAGVAWKGYKHDWNLQAAYQTSMWASYGISTPIANVGMGFAYSTDADDSWPSWVVDPGGVNAVTVGASATTDLSFGRVGTLMGGLTVDFGATRYWMITSECFNTTRRFLSRLWGITCKTCEGKWEKLKIGALRTMTHLTSFPVLTDMLHWVLAYAVQTQTSPRKPTETPDQRCSPISTNLRHNEIFIKGVIQRNLADAMQTLSVIDVLVEQLALQIQQAVDVEAEHTPEFKQLLRAVHSYSCQALPPTLGGMKDSIAFPKRNTLIYDYFPECDSDKSCPGYADGKQTCMTVRFEDQNMMGRCVCAKGYCHALSQGRDICRADPGTLQDFFRGLRSWRTMMAIEIGAHARTLEGGDQRGELTEEERYSVGAGRNAARKAAATRAWSSSAFLRAVVAVLASWQLVQAV